MASLESDHNQNGNALEHLLSIWPIVSSIAKSTPAGDLISLSRTSTSIRACTHGFPADQDPGEQRYETSRGFLDLRIGNHQTPYWETLKSLAAFSCSSPFHKEPKTAGSMNNVTRPCKYCSRPVCKACIVRSFFADPSQSKNTFRYRTRYLCQKCWTSGNLRKDFRYPAEGVSREHVWRGRSHGQRGGVCSCSASEDNWLCRGCRSLQQISGPTNTTLADADKNSKDMITLNREIGDTLAVPVECYGLGCTNVVDDANRDRRRICLWCSRSLPRQFGGSDRLRWEEKQVEIRAAAAAARSADIEEWARNRLKTFTMSRRDMRGTENCILLTGKDNRQHDERIFVRHLDTVNYRKYMRAETAPSPASVYQSKQGRWVYSRPFLEAFSRLVTTSCVPESIDRGQLFELTSEGALKAARRNFDTRWLLGGGSSAAIGTLAAQLCEAGLMEEEDIDRYKHLYYNNPGGHETLKIRMFEQLEKWQEMDEEARAAWQPQKFSDLLLEFRAEPSELPQEGKQNNGRQEPAVAERDSEFLPRQVQSPSNEEQAPANQASTSPPIPTYEAVMNGMSMTDQVLSSSHVG